MNIVPDNPNKRKRMLQLQLCFRETSLFDEMTQLYTLAGRANAVRYATLSVGDLCWHKVDESDSSGVQNNSEDASLSPKRFGLIAERKRVDDLAASIVDGRWKEQFGRASALNLRHAMLYIIDGRLNTVCRGAPFKSRLGAVVKKVARDDVPVAVTYSIRETAEFIMFLHFYLEQIEESELERSNSGNYVDHMQYTGGSKRGMQAEHALEHTLIIIPGVSANIAKCIAEKYQGVPDFIASCVETPGLTQRSIESINTLVGQKRCVGPALSMRIVEWFVGPHEKWSDYIPPKKKRAAPSTFSLPQQSPKRLTRKDGGEKSDDNNNAIDLDMDDFLLDDKELASLDL